MEGCARSDQHAGSVGTDSWSDTNAATHGFCRAEQAVDRFYRSYWYPFYGYLRRHGYGPEDAQDLVQGFFVHLLERGGGAKALPLDVANAENRYRMESRNGETPEQAFEQQWALPLIQKVLALLEAEDELRHFVQILSR